MRKPSYELARAWEDRASRETDKVMAVKYFRYAAAEYRAIGKCDTARLMDDIAAGIEAQLRAQQWVKA